MASLEEIRLERIKKLELLKERGFDPYPSESKQDYTLAETVRRFDELTAQGEINLVGRVMAMRGQGALVFIDLDDGTGRLQALLKKDVMPEEAFALFQDTVDMGDFIQVTGTLFVTKREEKTLEVKAWSMLAKSLRPLPDKWHGLQDIEERFRKRYLDSLMDEEVKKRFVIRSKVISRMRAILDRADYLEVDTPVLQPLYGGASAEPFMTHHNALDIDLYLRISDELYLKRMLVGNFPKVYEIARDFRNEGIDATHNPEFTMLEFYESYSDATRQRQFVEEMLKDIVQTIFATDSLVYNETTIDFSKPFKIVSYLDLLKEGAGIADTESRDGLIADAERLGVAVEAADSVPKILDNIYKKMCRPKLIQPTFIIDYPADYLPLAKRLPNKPHLVDAFQLVAGGIELVKAFSELNDPIDQKERFLSQEKQKEAGEADAQRYDEDFIEALEHGMPPAGGVGIGIDRLTMFLTDTKNIKEVIYFPLMRPKSSEE